MIDAPTEGACMFWSLSLPLVPEEAVLEDSISHPLSKIKPAYSVFLTNKRIVFRFDPVLRVSRNQRRAACDAYDDHVPGR
jgi:hypothetical protein